MQQKQRETIHFQKQKELFYPPMYRISYIVYRDITKKEKAEKEAAERVGDFDNCTLLHCKKNSRIFLR